MGEHKAQEVLYDNLCEAGAQVTALNTALHSFLSLPVCLEHLQSLTPIEVNHWLVLT